MWAVYINKYTILCIIFISINKKYNWYVIETHFDLPRDPQRDSFMFNVIQCLWECIVCCTKKKRKKKKHVAYSSGSAPYFLYLVLFIYLFWFSLGCQMYSQCGPHRRHRFRKENRSTGGLCCAIIPVFLAYERMSHISALQSQEQPNHNLSLEK